MKSPILNLTLAAIALIVLGCGGAAMVDAQEPETPNEATSPEPTTAFVLKVDPLTICKAWMPTDCPDVVLKEGEIARCDYEIVTSPDLEDVVCLGAGCKKLIEDYEVLIISLSGNQALFCGEPAP